MLTVAFEISFAECIGDCVGNKQPKGLTSTVDFRPSLQFQHYGVEHGLSNISIGERSILRDRQGFLWIATQDGLNRYDGHQFKHFFHDPNNDNSISNNITGALFEDDKGLIWIGTWGGGINRFDPVSEKFTRYKLDTLSQPNFRRNYISDITQDNNGTIWAGTQNGLVFKKASQDEFEPYIHSINGEIPLASIDVRVLHYDSHNYLWVGTRDEGIVRINLTNHQHDYFTQSSPNPFKLHHNDIQDIYEDHQSNIWISTSSGLSYFDVSKQHINWPFGEFERHPLNHELVRKITGDAEGNLWITTLFGLFQVDSRTLEFKLYRHDPSDITSLSSHDVNTIYRDNEGNIWLGFQENGLDRFHPAQQHFNFHKSFYQNYKGSNNLPVSTLLLDNHQSLWIGTPGNGLYRKREGDNDSDVVQYNVATGSLSDNQISSLFLDSGNNVWVGTFGGGLNRYDDETDSLSTFSFDRNVENSLSNNYVHSMAQDSSGALWVGTSQGLNRLDEDGTSFTRFFSRNSKPHSHRGQSIQSIEPDKNGNLWLGTKEGLFYFHTKTYEYKQFVHVKDQTDSLSNNWVVAIYLDKQERLWIGTAGGGLNLFDPMTQKFERFGLKEGLPSGIVYDIFQDSEGIMWISTANGLVSFDYSSNRFLRYTTLQGLQDNNFNVGAFQATNGELFFGGPKGFNRFFPEQIKAQEEQQESKVVLTDFLLFNKSVSVASTDISFNTTGEQSSVLKRSIFSTEKIVLDHTHNLFGFEFSDLNFNHSKQGFIYRLKGWDENWVMTDSNKRYATYTNIPPGDYEFQVMTVSESTGATILPTSVGIVINAAPWKTYWAYTLYSLLALSMIATFYWLVLRKKAAEEETRIATEIAATKEQLLANVSHEFRTPLTLILGPVRTLLEQVNNETSVKLLNHIEENGKRLLSMVEQLLDMAKISWSHEDDLKPLSLVTACRSIVHSFQPVANQKQIKLDLFTTLENECFVDISADNLETLLINLLSNAIKYTPPKGTITISIEETSDMVVIKVSDTGYGIDPRDQRRIFDRFTRVEHTQHIAPGAGIGLSLVKTIVKRSGGTISVCSKLNKGSEFKVTLPRSKKIEAFKSNGQFVTSYSVTRSIEDLTSNLNMVRAKDRTFQGVVHSSNRVSKENQAIERTLLNCDKPSLLVVEDNFEMRSYICDLLKDDFDVLQASDGDQGLTLAKQECPDLIIADVMMPRLDGFQMLNKIRNELITSHIPVILLTAKGDQQSRLKGLSALADDYLTKPFVPKELMTRIHNLLIIREILKVRFRNTVCGQAEKSAGHRTSNTAPESKAFTEKELQFYRKFEKYIAQRYHETGLVLSMVAKELAMSDRQFQRKLSALGMGFSEFLKSYRLEQASQMLKAQEKITSICEKVGFSSSTYFARCFKAKYGCSPSQYRDDHQVKTEVDSV